MPNAMDGVSDRDFALDLLYDIAVILHTLQDFVRK